MKGLSKSIDVLPTTFTGKRRKRVQMRIEKKNMNTLTYAQFKEEIIKQFRHPKAKTDVGLKRSERVQNLDESARDFIYEMQILIQKYNPTRSENDVVSLIASFLRPYYSERIGTKTFCACRNFTRPTPKN